jgi:Tfp pilus assembly protein PilO
MGKFNSLGLIIISGALFMLFTKPQLAKIGELNQQKASYNQAISDMRQIDQKKNELISRLNSFPQEDIAKIDAMLPDKPNVVQLVGEIENMSAKYGIIVTNISTDSGNFTASVGTDAPTKNYQSTKVGFDFEARYEDMKRLLTDLESSLRILDIRNIEVKRSTGNVFGYHVDMEIYWVSAKQSQALITSPI